MALKLVGETIDKDRSHYGAETGKLVKLMRGLYVDADDDIDAVVLRHTVRIARYLYPRTYLSAASAVLLGPTRDGHLYISGRRNQRTRIRAIEIVQNQAPPNPAVEAAVIADGMGEIRIDVSSVRQRFLEAFRMRSEHAASVDENMREAIKARLIEEYGGAQAAAAAVWVLARQNEWYREGEQAERFLLSRIAASVVSMRSAAQVDLVVAWHGTPMGHLRHDGLEWRWSPSEDVGPPVVRQTTPGKLPPFIISLLPEGWLETVLRNPDERAALRSGKRYMSNITIVERVGELAGLPADVLLEPLERHSAAGVFTGTYAGPGRGAIAESFESNLARLYDSRDTPRLSGVQMKAPMYLDREGTLSPATEKPFTHILKPPGRAGFETLPVVEWLAMELGRTAGFTVPSAVLVAMPDDMPPALVVERFDVRVSLEDRRLIALEDFCSVTDLPASAKYDGTIERLARAIRPLSTEPEEDLLILFKRALFAWLIADGDMHMKNLALLKIADPGAARFREVRLAPLYDAVTTRVFPHLEHDRLALKLNGKDDRLDRADFRKLAATAGLRAATAEDAMETVCAALRRAVEAVRVPVIAGGAERAATMQDQMYQIVRTRIESIA